MRLAAFATLIVAFAGVPTARGESERVDPAAQVVDRLPALSEEEKLLLVDRLPIGSHYRDALSVIPDLGSLRLESWFDSSLTEALVPVELLGRRVDLELNFQDSVLYGFYYGLFVSDAVVADSLFNCLVKFYQSRYGDPLVWNGEGSPDPIRHRRWQREDYDVGVGLSGEGSEKRWLGWGFQRPASVPE